MLDLPMADLSIDDLLDIEDIHRVVISADGRVALCSVRQVSGGPSGRAGEIWRLDTGSDPRQRKLGLPGRNPREFVLDPTCDRIAFVADAIGTDRVDVPHLFVAKSDGSACKKLVGFSSGIAGLTWGAAADLVFFTAWTVGQTATSASEMRCVSERREESLSVFVTEQAYYRSWDRFLPGIGAPTLFACDASTGECVDILAQSGYELPRWGSAADSITVRGSDANALYFLFDPQSAKHYGNPLGIAMAERSSGVVRPLVVSPDWSFASLSMSPDQMKLAFLATSRRRGHANYSLPGYMDLATQRWYLLAEQSDITFESPIRWSHDSSALFMRGQSRGRNHIWKVACDKPNPSIIVQGGWVTDFDVAYISSGDRLAFLMDSHRHPAQAYFHDASMGTARLDSFNDALLTRLTLGSTQEVSIAGAGSDAIQVWLTFPPRFDAQIKYPVFIHLHGGPHVAVGDRWNFRWNNHLLAANGYVVAAVNFHGSTGFGYEFMDSISGRWGKLEVADIEATITWLRIQVWVDRDRIFAGGGSYGGTLSTWLNGAASPNAVRALVCHGGVFDWTSMMAQDVYFQLRDALGGCPWESRQLLESQSPSSVALQFKTPTLVMHARDDYRVPDAQGFSHYNTLCALGIPCRLVWFSNDNHRVNKRSNSKRWYEELLTWLGRFV